MIEHALVEHELLEEIPSAWEVEGNLAHHMDEKGVHVLGPPPPTGSNEDDDLFSLILCDLDQSLL